MSTVAAVVYRNGQRVRETSIDAAEGLQLDEGEFVWIGLFEPGEEELRTLQRRFDLHPLAVEDALRAHQLPKVEVYGDQLFAVTRTAELADDQVRYGETDIFAGARHLITVRHGSARAHTELRDRLEASPNLLRHGVGYVLYAVLDFVVDGYLPILETVEEQVLEMEQRAMEAFLSRADVNWMVRLRRGHTRFTRLVGPMTDMCRRLEHLDLAYIDPEIRPYFRDVYDHVRRVEARADGLREVLNSVFEASSLLEAQRQGAITRKLAAWAAILAVPTAVAGVYGMNFEYMPELKWRYGYAMVLACMAALCVWLYVRFKRAKWL